MEKTHIYIAGPCAAESEQMVMETAQAIGPGVVFRAGVWKPRSKPETYQGAGEVALSWLQRVRRELGMAVATEVATPEQAQAAVRAEIDHLWIGARTSANPIAVQAIADAIHSIDPLLRRPTHIWIKNPVNEDVALWMGNIRRMQQTGIETGAIHRGCGHRPCWAMAHALRQQMPDIRLLLDPSHMSGEATRVLPLSDKMWELGLDGLMVEVHPRPAEALSDSPQQITPSAWHELCGTQHTEPTDSELAWLRSIIDETDDQLWDIILRRMEISREIGAYKQHKHMSVLQPQRYEQMLNGRIRWGQATHIAEDTIRQIMDAIHRESCRRQV